MNPLFERALQAQALLEQRLPAAPVKHLAPGLSWYREASPRVHPDSTGAASCVLIPVLLAAVA